MSDHERVVSRCPNCGAPLPAHDRGAAVTCGFCELTSTPAPAAPPAPAPAVIAVMPIAVEAPGAPVGVYPCPRCALPLAEGRAEGVVLRGCGGCGGVWIDNESARRSLEGASAAGVVELATRASSRAARRPDRAAIVRCPACQAPLGRVAHPSGVEIDVCPAHGTWFDAHELALVLDAARPKAATPTWTEYHGPTPDFREGANTEIAGFARIFAIGAASLLGGIALGAAGTAPAGRR